ncbi:hypothetical protein VIGAN_06197700 [Vigna angularis var. angularis]|uniref:Uncharacterized protein n=1 Tax=Vigna angularis var. angularis TaxID=157739 RepID=A0A0S3SD52_PHAAN|nr:hypothetical protein VIGAN_06197700 [Vigna angularis var. angularis]
MQKEKRTALSPDHHPHFLTSGYSSRTPPPTSISSRELIVILSLVPPPGFIFNLSSRPSSPTPLYPLNEQFVLSSIASSPFHPFVPSIKYPFETNKPMFF